MRASIESGGRALLQCSHVGRSSSIALRPDALEGAAASEYVAWLAVAVRDEGPRRGRIAAVSADDREAQIAGRCRTKLARADSADEMPVLNRDLHRAAALRVSTDPRSQIEGLERSDQITWALRQLDEASRAAVVLRYYEGMSSAEIAQLTDSTPTAVDMRLSRARRRMKELLNEPDPCGAAAGSTDQTSL